MKTIVILAAAIILTAITGYSADYSVRNGSAPVNISASGNVDTFVESKIVVEDVSANSVPEKSEEEITNEDLIDMSAVAMGVGIF